ncbi:MAG: glycerophosphodiester phosphodiesterase family protein [Leadbetterella sp.]|nr:glycerophosphodiester phosphodiesterase family protein [Leadbetterella sp.]
MRSAFFLFLLSFGLYAQKPEVAAHRGKSPCVPENTVRGIQKLLPSGIKYIEIDVRTSKDGRLLILHDGSLKRTTNSKARVKDLTWHELQQVRISGWLNIRFRNNRIPSWRKFVGVVSGWNSLHPSHPVYLYVDCKEADPQAAAGYFATASFRQGICFLRQRCLPGRAQKAGSGTENYAGP